MIGYTTPTMPIVVSSGQLETTHCDVYVSFRVGKKVITVRPYLIESDVEHDTSILYLDLSQLDTGFLSTGVAQVQVNLVDWMGYRAATQWKTWPIGTNILDREVVNTWPN